MFRKHILILSTALLIWGGQDHMSGIACGTLEFCRTASGSISLFSAVDKAHAVEPLRALASAVATLSIVALCPATPLGAVLGGMLIFFSGLAIEFAGAGSEVLARHLNKATGVGTYIFLSSIPFGTNVAFLITFSYLMLINISNHSKSIPGFKGIFLRLFLDTISIRWISGHYSYELSVITKSMLFVLSAILIQHVFYHPKSPFSALLLASSTILFMLSLFISLNFWFISLIIILFELISWYEVGDKFKRPVRA